VQDVSCGCGGGTRLEREGRECRHAQDLGEDPRGYRSGILLAHYDFPISTGPLEGTNNKIKTMKRQAYGFRDDMEFFKLKIMAIHETKYALVG
jgi:transposase